MHFSDKIKFLCTTCWVISCLSIFHIF